MPLCLTSSLSVNLIARGDGRLDVARQLVSKSFAMWEKRQVEERRNAALDMPNEDLSEALLVSAQERFMNTLQESLQIQIDQRRAKFDVGRLEYLVGILDDKELLKKTSKSFLGKTKMLELEKSTLDFLNDEIEKMKSSELEDEMYAEMVKEDRTSLLEQIEAQQERVLLLEKEFRKHPFTAIANIANEIMAEDCPEGEILLDRYRSAREEPIASRSWLTAYELSTFAKSAIVARRNTRKLATVAEEIDQPTSRQQIEDADSLSDGTWEDTLAIIKTLVAYGCLEVIGSSEIPQDKKSWEQSIYSITPAGMNVGMLGFENSLWALIAMGGAWDVSGASSNLDEFHRAMDALESDNWYDDEAAVAPEESIEVPVAQQEAEKLLSLIRNMSPAELAGYVATIVSEGSRGGGGGPSSVVEAFHQLTPLQQHTVQTSLQCLERFSEIQRLNNVDMNTRQANMDITTVEVVTAWADGCTWNEAIQISGGVPPGDLARTLSRVLDAVRQLGNLPFTPVRKYDLDNSDTVHRVSRGIHPDVRRLCRDAATAINRYPVKDPFSFEDGEDNDDDDNNNNNTVTSAEDSETTAEMDASGAA